MARSRASVHGTDLWDRAVHDGTTVTADGEVALDRGDRLEPPVPPPGSGSAAPHDGPAPDGPGPTGSGPGPALVIDEAGHLYRTVPDQGRIERYRLGWSGRRLVVEERLGDWPTVPSPPATGPATGFRTAAGGPPVGFRPGAIAADGDGGIWVAEVGTGEVAVHDRWSRRIRQRFRVGDATPGPHRGRVVLDLAADGAAVYAVCDAPGGVVRLSLGVEPRELPTPELARPARPVRVAARNGVVAVLYQGSPPSGPDGSGSGDQAWVVVHHRRGAEPDRPEVIPVAGATDLAVHDTDRDGRPDRALFVADGPGGMVSHFRFGAGRWRLERRLAARGWDGRGLLALPDGSVGFWSGAGLQRPLAGRGRLRTTGRVTTLALDRREFGGRWGRLFLEACIPPGTSVQVHAAVSDDEERDDETPPAPPPSVGPGAGPVGGPPRVPRHLRPGPGEVTGRLHRRVTGRPEPWSRPAADDGFATYEAPVDAGPGRYLWLTFELSGTGSAGPRLRTVQVERSTHGHLERLPRVYTRHDSDGFLERYLAVLTGTVDDLDDRAAQRRVLLDPRSVPEEALPWLAGFVGLVLDDRWPLDARRRLVAEATRLLSRRGTVTGLSRMLEILLGVAPILVEHFRLRGVGGIGLGPESATDRSAAGGPVVGAGFRVGGALHDGPRPGAEVPAAGHATGYAHRFTVLVPRHLGPDERDALDHLLTVHAPAHTGFEVCELGVGMRTGRGLHLGLSSLIGPTGAWRDTRVGHWAVGRDAVLGRPGSPRVPVAIDAGGYARWS
ncbi:MAG: phage tail protein [Acidimicrobiales bacterium]